MPARHRPTRRAVVGPAALVAVLLALAGTLSAAPPTDAPAGRAAAPAAGVLAQTGGGDDARSGAGRGEASTLRVTDFGAACDGRTDDAAAIQAAFDAAAARGAATVVFPAASCNVGRTLHLGGGHGPGDGSTFINLVGVSPAQSRLVWTGSTGGELLRVEQNRFALIAGLGFVNRAGARGSTVGIRLTGPSPAGDGSGTQTHVSMLERVSLSGWHQGIVAGEQGHGLAASEILYLNLSLDDNDIGWINQDLNTLDHYFINAGGWGNTVCFKLDSGNAYFDGGSLSNNGTDFEMQHTAYGAVENWSIRNMRSEGAGTFVHMGIGGTLTIEDNLVTAPRDPPNAIHGTFGGPVTIRGNRIEGAITIEGASTGSVYTVEDNSLLGDGTRPFFVSQDGTTPGYLNRAVIHAARNSNAAATGGYDYLFDDVDGVWNGRGFQVTRSVSYGDQDRQVPSERLQAVSMLAQGSSAAGRNLHVAGRFASSGTLRIPFTRTETVDAAGAGSEAGTRRFVVASGHFSTGDVGRRVVVAAASGYVTRIVDATHVDVHFVADGQPAGTGLAATVGEDEPDAEYMLFPSCDANETFAFSHRTSTGFTLASSNPRSTALCFVLIVR